MEARTARHGGVKNQKKNKVQKQNHFADNEHHLGRNRPLESILDGFTRAEVGRRRQTGGSQEFLTNLDVQEIPEEKKRRCRPED